MSLQKYAATATSVPRCSATSNVWLKRSFCSRYVHSAAQGTRMRWPDDEIGQELGQPLNDPEDERLAVRERVGVVPHSREREDDGEAERGPRDAEHDGAAHGEILRSCPPTRVGSKTGANCGNPVNGRLTRSAVSHRFPLAPSTERE